MKTTRLLFVLSLLAGLLASATAQAFCFSMGSKHSRFNDYKSYPMPAAGFMPQQYYAYPYSAMQVTPWYDGNGRLVSAPGLQGTDLDDGQRDWRKQ